jgi:hypothetical protein
MKIMAIEVARRIRAHVRNGGWLGVSWPHYIVPEGTTLSQLNAGWDLAVKLAAREGGDLEGDAEENFQAACAA